MNENQTKATKGQLERRIRNAIVFVPKTKSTISIFFSDKGIKLTADDEMCVIETGYHKHVFYCATNNGISRPWLYTKRVIEIATENLDAIKTENGYYFNVLLDTLKNKEDKSEYNITVFYDWWLQIIFAPLYSIGETEGEQFLLYEYYIHYISRSMILLDQRNEDVTNKQFVEKIFENMREFINNIVETVFLKKKTDEDIIQENADAITEAEQEEWMLNSMEENESKN